jgi:hypothetical protein
MLPHAGLAYAPLHAANPLSKTASPSPMWQLPSCLQTHLHIDSHDGFFVELLLS